jgi:hypothetical protein
MSETIKIKYATERNGELKDFPLNSQTIVLPNGVELSLRYDPIRSGLTVTKLSDGELLIQPHVSNQILIK